MTQAKVFSTVLADKDRTRLTMGSYLQWITPFNKTAKLYKVDIDLAFQSRTRWDNTQKQNFINSCLIDMNISKFVLVDVKRCLASAKTKEDKKYYQSWLDLGVEFLNVDYNNRTTTLREFKNDKISIPLGDYFIPSYGTFKITKDNNLYSTMPDDFRIIFESSILSTHIIVEASREQLSDVFERMNSGESLNFYEKINCSFSTTCEEIRDCTTFFADAYLAAKLFKESEVNRRKIDAWFAHIFYIWDLGFTIKFSESVHKKWYNKNSVSNKSVSKFVNEFKSFNKLVGKKIVNFHYKWALFDLFYMISKEIKNNKILTNENIVLDFIEMITKLSNDKTAKYAYEEVTNNETVYFPFKQFYRGGDVANFTARHRVYKKEGWNMSKYFGETKDPKRTLTRMEKQGIASRDGWVTNDGTPFLPEDTFDGSKDAGHIVAHAKGGKTISSNMVIENASENRSKQMKETVVKQ